MEAHPFRFYLYKCSVSKVWSKDLWPLSFSVAMRGFDVNKNKVLDEDERTRLVAYIQVKQLSNMMAPRRWVFSAQPKPWAQGPFFKSWLPTSEHSSPRKYTDWWRFPGNTYEVRDSKPRYGKRTLILVHVTTALSLALNSYSMKHLSENNDNGTDKIHDQQYKSYSTSCKVLTEIKTARTVSISCAKPATIRGLIDRTLPKNLKSIVISYWPVFEERRIQVRK